MPAKKSKAPISVVKAVPCADKNFETAPPQDHPLSMPRGARICIVGPVGVGKSSLIKNELVRSSRFAAVYVIHGAGEHSQEYDIIQPHTKTSFAEASPDYWAEQTQKHGGQPLAVVCDDVSIGDCDKKEKSHVYSLMQFCASHFNITVWMVAHSWTQLVPRVRRCCNIVHLYPNSVGGSDQLSYQARSLGMSAPTLARAFSKCKGQYSFLVIYTGNDVPDGRARIMIDGCTPFEP